MSTNVTLVCLLLCVACVLIKASDEAAQGENSERMKEFLAGLSDEDKQLIKKYPSKYKLIDALLGDVKQTDPNFKKRTLPDDYNRKTKPAYPGHVVSKKELTKDSVKHPSKSLDELTDKIIADIELAKQNGVSLADLLRNIKERNGMKTAKNV